MLRTVRQVCQSAKAGVRPCEPFMFEFPFVPFVVKIFNLSCINEHP
jgi:hypothetical protein